MTEEPQKLGIIDAWCNLTPPRHLETYAKSEKFKHIEFAMRLFKMEDRLKYWTISPEDFMAEVMDPLGIEKVVVPVGQGAGALAPKEFTITYEDGYEFIRRHPDRFVGLAKVDPNQGMKAVRELDRAVREYGFKGAHMHPYSIGKPLNDPIYYPIYAKCAELEVAVEVQVGHSAELMPSSYGRPILLDDVALHFPELRIVAGHTGWPWVEELIALAWKHPNLYIGTSAHAPKYWDPSLVRFMNTRGQDKVVFSTDFPVIDHRRALAEIEENNILRDEAKGKVLRENALRVFKL